MKNTKLIFLLLISIILHSCTVEDSIQSNGENSFIAKLNGENFIAANITSFPSGTRNGLSAFHYDNNWLIKVSNGSDNTLYFNLLNITAVGKYQIGKADNNLSFFDNQDFETSVLIGSGNLELKFHTKGINQEFITINELQGDSIIVGEFEKITLTNPENLDKKIILSNGKFNINKNTLNQ